MGNERKFLCKQLHLIFAVTPHQSPIIEVISRFFGACARAQKSTSNENERARDLLIAVVYRFNARARCLSVVSDGIDSGVKKSIWFTAVDTHFYDIYRYSLWREKLFSIAYLIIENVCKIVIKIFLVSSLEWDFISLWLKKSDFNEVSSWFFHCDQQKFRIHIVWTWIICFLGRKTVIKNHPGPTTLALLYFCLAPWKKRN